MDKITLLIVGITLWLLQVKARPSQEPPQDGKTTLQLIYLPVRLHLLCLV